MLLPAIETSQVQGGRGDSNTHTTYCAYYYTLTIFIPMYAGARARANPLQEAQEVKKPQRP